MLADDIAWALPDLRAEAEQQFSSTCEIRGKSTGRTTDPDTGAVTPTPGALIYAGPCRVRPASGPGGTGSSTIVGGAELFAFDYLVSIPFAVAGVAEHQRVKITASPDPALVDVEVEIEHVDRGENLTARRLQCSEVA